MWALLAIEPSVKAFLVIALPSLLSFIIDLLYPQRKGRVVSFKKNRSLS
jgi:hypothetical protein